MLGPEPGSLVDCCVRVTGHSCSWVGRNGSCWNDDALIWCGEVRLKSLIRVETWRWNGKDWHQWARARLTIRIAWRGLYQLTAMDVLSIRLKMLFASEDRLLTFPFQYKTSSKTKRYGSLLRPRENKVSGHYGPSWACLVSARSAEISSKRGGAYGRL